MKIYRPRHADKAKRDGPITDHAMGVLLQVWTLRCGQYGMTYASEHSIIILTEGWRKP